MPHSWTPWCLYPRRNVLLSSSFPSSLWAEKSGPWVKKAFSFSPHPGGFRKPRAASGLDLEARARRSQMSLPGKQKKNKNKNHVFHLGRGLWRSIRPPEQGNWEGRSLLETHRCPWKDSGFQPMWRWSFRPCILGSQNTERPCSYRGKVSSKSLEIDFKLPPSPFHAEARQT